MSDTKTELREIAEQLVQETLQRDHFTTNEMVERAMRDTAKACGWTGTEAELSARLKDVISARD